MIKSVTNCKNESELIEKEKEKEGEPYGRRRKK